MMQQNSMRGRGGGQKSPNFVTCYEDHPMGYCQYRRNLDNFWQSKEFMKKICNLWGGERYVIVNFWDPWLKNDLFSLQL